MRYQKNNLVKILLVIFVCLNIYAFANLWSASNVHFFKQLQHLAIATGVLVFIGWLAPIKFLEAQVPWFVAFIILLLSLVLLFGDDAGGARRWLQWGGIRGQPSEFAKIVMILYTAYFFSKKPLTRPYRLKELWLLGLVLGLIVALIFLQPDLGTAGVCVLIVLSQLFFIRINSRDLIILGSILFVGLILGWQLLLYDYQKQRVLTLLNPQKDPLGTGYHAIQSLIAIGSGEVFGKGFLAGTQTQLQFLPARHTDFIFSVVAEEHGFIGGSLLLILFFVLFLVMIQIAKNTRDTFTGLLAIGLTAFIMIEFFINVAMVLGLFPIVGMPLPFFSFGGSSLIVTYSCIGFFIAIEKKRTNEQTAVSLK